MAFGPSPEVEYPFAGLDNLGTKLVYLKNIITRSNIIVGDYTYYHDFEDPKNFERNVLYHYDFLGDKLIIGKFCSIASDVKFIMNGGNLHTDWFTSYPFPVFGQGWETVPYEWPNKGDTIIGHNVWIGYGATFLPGVNVGDGAIIGAQALVTKSVAPYTMVGGNPAREIRTRFDSATIQALQELGWWNWDIQKITRNLKAICGADLETLKRSL